MSIRRPLIIAVVTAAGLAGCGGGESSSPSPAPGSSSAQERQTTPEPKASTPAYGEAGKDGVTRVGMLDLRFEPLEVTVKPGAKVLFVNDGKVTHNAKSDHFFTRVVEPGDEKAVRASRKTGRYHYVCTFHPGMEATLVVEK